MSTRRDGQALLESLVVLPMLISVVTLFFGLVLLGGTVYLLEDRLEETLLCLTYRARETCQKEFDQFLGQTGLQRFQVKSQFVRNGDRWSGRLEFDRPWGGRFEIRRQLRQNLTENRR